MKSRISFCLRLTSVSQVVIWFCKTLCSWNNEENAFLQHNVHMCCSAVNFLQLDVLRRNCMSGHQPIQLIKQNNFQLSLWALSIYCIHQHTYTHGPLDDFLYRYSSHLPIVGKCNCIFSSKLSRFMFTCASLHQTIYKHTHTHTRSLNATHDFDSPCVIFVIFSFFSLAALGEFHNCAIAGFTVSQWISQEQA